jgi:hypothetical protein
MTEKEGTTMPELAQGTTIEGPATPGRAVARRQPLPKELAALGVVAAVDPESGMQVLIIPKALREKFNVLAPVQAFQQADPNWRPSLRVVELDPSPEGPHFYKQTGGKLAPRKQALELLADAAGITEMRTQLLGRERVEVGGVMAETFTHLASGKIRKSDGTLRVLEASRTYEPFAEYEEIVTSVSSGQYAKKPGTAEFDTEVRKRWLNEIKFAKAKNESKAANRVIRAAIQSSHTYTPARAALPFVVVGWNLAPQDSAAVQAAIAQLYGAEASHTAIPVHADWSGYELDEPEALPDGEVVDETDETSSAPDSVREPAGESVADEQGPEEGTDEQPPAPPPSEPEAEPTIPGLEPDSEPQPEVEAHPSGLTDGELKAVSAFGKTKPIVGSHQTKTVAYIFSLGDAADEHISWLLRNWPTARPAERESHRLLVLACRVHRPDLYEAWLEEQEVPE